MVFSSITFVYYYLPCVLLLYFAAPGKFKNGVLFISSLVFYAWGEPISILLMLSSIVVSYAVGRLIEKYRGTGKSGILLVLGLIFAAGLLMYFKYAGFFLVNLNQIAGTSFSVITFNATSRLMPKKERSICI